jgi:hypothetical protein
MKHKYETPETCNCGGHTQRCAICDFGLTFCVKCKGAEVAMPTECPGRPMTAEESELVARGDLDYDMGVWFHLGQPVFKDGKVFK